MAIPIRYSVRSLVQRPARSLLTMLGSALAVFVAVLMLGLARGLRETVAGSASASNVVVLSAGSESMEFSALEPADLLRIRGHQAIAAADGQPLVSPEAFLSSMVTVEGRAGEHRAMVRGVEPVALAVHPQIRMTAGRTPSGLHEIVTGGLAETKLGLPRGALDPGVRLGFEGETWTVVGRFEAPGTPLEAEIWGRLGDLQTATRRTDVSAVILRATGPEAAADLVFDLSTRTDVRVAAWTESDYYAGAAARLRPIAAASMAVAVMLTAGAALAALNTMWTSVLGRVREMAVLVVRGFHRAAVLTAFLLESLALSLGGGLLGALAAWPLHRLPMRLPMGAFRFAISPALVGFGLLLAAGIGLVGALVPLLHVARRPLASALRSE